MRLHVAPLVHLNLGVHMDPGPHAVPDLVVWMARLAGALAGSAISLGYLLPRRRREAFLRFGVGVAAGLVFGAPAGIHMVRFLDMRDEVTRLEMNLIGATLVSLCAWSSLGIVTRLLRHHGMSIAPDDNDRRLD